MYIKQALQFTFGEGLTVQVHYPVFYLYKDFLRQRLCCFLYRHGFLNSCKKTKTKQKQKKPLTVKRASFLMALTDN